MSGTQGTAPKRGFRLQEFAAHSTKVNCAYFGRKFSGVLVTGGEDRKINMWAVGKPHALLSLSGHQSAVESVMFDREEESVLAGAAGGTVKMWDLEQARVTRTFTGHRANCLCLDYHPFGQFFGSGSLDTNFKVWDVRQKVCVHTYKGKSLRHQREWVGWHARTKEHLRKRESTLSFYLSFFRSNDPSLFGARRTQGTAGA